MTRWDILAFDDWHYNVLSYRIRKKPVIARLSNVDIHNHEDPAKPISKALPAFINRPI